MIHRRYGHSPAVSTTARLLPLPSEAVWATLCNGWSYADWVVGTRKIRDVEGPWPARGSRLHYTAGYGPAKLEQTTTVVALDEGHWLELDAAGWPFGRIRIVLRLSPATAGCRVALDEAPVFGPAVIVHNAVTDQLLHRRNVETLRRLGEIAGGRAPG